jgi:DNA (cytosine-5)-methyltransferase 1
LAAYNTGLRFDEHYFSEIDEYAVSIYKKRFPNAIPLGDIMEVNFEKMPKGEWLITGGFPCQPHSSVGLRKGKNDERNLWPICKDIMCKIRPRIALFENVVGLFSSNGGYFFNEVLSDISEIGYDSEWQIISAKEIGAPHLRKWIWIVAYSSSERFHVCEVQNKIDSKTTQEMFRNEASDKIIAALCGPDTGISEREFLREYYGLSEELDRYKCLGNAIVPQCAEKIMRLPAFDLWRVR